MSDKLCCKIVLFLSDYRLLYSFNANIITVFSVSGSIAFCR